TGAAPLRSAQPSRAMDMIAPMNPSVATCIPCQVSPAPESAPCILKSRIPPPAHPRVLAHAVGATRQCGAGHAGEADRLVVGVEPVDDGQGAGAFVA
ncbi:hypothetical protein ACFRCI_41115, partial [Streptomyces sp. NPDC056638]|uniref:hypothetical protein n=1 Tax=Streptomyces sp. NPDC056638 TaxID=3345887 RepID=UPI0036CE498B